jgi:threonine/homoserine/homoserine lactone efflux protein
VPPLETLVAFALVTFVLVATPGPGVLYLVAQAAGEGRRAGFASMLGVEAGDVCYIVLTAAGVSALLARSALALSGLRYGGATYLIFLGLRYWRRSGVENEPPRLRPGHAFAQGFIIQIFNPKVALFFLAYFPLYIHAHRAIALQVAALGGVYALVALISDTVYVLAASALAQRFVANAWCTPA